MRTVFPARSLAVALALTMSLILPGAATAQQTAPAVPQAQAAGTPETAPIPAQSASDEDTPPPFVKRPAQPPRPPRPDLTFAQGKAPLEFRGLPWGASLDKARTQLPDLAAVTTPLPLKDTFARKDELLKLGEADLKSVAYYFPKGRLSGVGIVFEGEANFFLIKEQLIRQFGPGRQMGDRYGWTWANFFVEMRLRGQTGELRYTYAP